MTAITDIVDGVADELNDPGYLNWSPAQHLRAMDRAMAMVLRAKPAQYTQQASVTITSGPRNRLVLAGAVKVADIASITTGGSTFAASETGLQYLGYDGPTWMQAPLADLYNWARDPVDPLSFYTTTWGAGVTATVSYFATPAVSTLGGVFPLTDLWVPAVRDYMIYSAWSQDREFANDPTRANAHRAFFQAMLS